MKKLMFVLFALMTSASLFAQDAAKDAAPKLEKGEKPKEIVTTTTEEVYAEITPEKEAKELTEMVTQQSKIDETQKTEIYKIVLASLKEKVNIESLREENAEEHSKKEMEIFKTMNDKIQVVLKGE